MSDQFSEDPVPFLQDGQGARLQDRSEPESWGPTRNYGGAIRELDDYIKSHGRQLKPQEVEELCNSIESTLK